MIFKLTREFYIPKQATKLETVEGIDVYHYTNEEYNQPVAVCFVGKAQKPTWKYRFKSMEELIAMVNQTIEKYLARKNHLRILATEKKLRKAEAIKLVNVGDVFVETSSYESTVIDFWQVVTKRGATVELRKIGKNLVSIDSSGRNEDYMPLVDNFISDETKRLTISDKLSDSIYLICKSWYSFKSWNGKPVYQTNIYWR